MTLRRVGSLVCAIGVLLVAAFASSASAGSPIARASATCADYSNQADAQRAADTRDADGDGIYCESLQCPCLKPGGTSPTPAPAPAPAPKPKASYSRPSTVQRLSFSSSKYRNIKKHTFGGDRQRVAADPRAEPAQRRQTPRPPARGHPDQGWI